MKGHAWSYSPEVSHRPSPSEIPEELSIMVLSLSPTRKSELAWEMEMLLKEKKMGQAGE